MTLPELGSASRCEKCGAQLRKPHGESASMAYIPEGPDDSRLPAEVMEEHIERECSRCGYIWWEAIWEGE